MGEQHKKHSRREHLNDFHLNVAGEYVYDGALYACQSDDAKQRRSKRAVWGMAAILTVAVAAGRLLCFGRRDPLWFIGDQEYRSVGGG